MATYKEITIPVAAGDLQEILVALLSGIGFEGFEEGDDTLKAFIAAGQLDEEVLTGLLHQYELSYSVQDIAEQNWNAVWEESFEPVVVGDLCVVRADFHAPAQGTKYEVVVTPKMSFGTGHHATTQLMIQQMGVLDMSGCSVLDFGTGTGVLAILAAKMGATNVLAIDNDTWSFENAKENVHRNDVAGITVSLDDITTISGKVFDIILANINRHILLEYMATLFSLTKDGGKVVMSGLLVADREIIVNAATAAGFKHENYLEANGWIAISFMK